MDASVIEVDVLKKDVKRQRGKENEFRVVAL